MGSTAVNKSINLQDRNEEENEEENGRDFYHNKEKTKIYKFAVNADCFAGCYLSDY